MANLSKLWTPAPALLADAFARGGVEMRIVGGAVRDAIGGRKNKDIDLATPATPIEMLRLGAQLGLRTVPLLAEVEAKPSEWSKGGLKHGTVPFVIDGHDGPEMVDVTTLRTDVSTDGRHAEVAFVRDFEVDAARRDFTFNAMSVDREGRLFDYFGGADDLRAGLVRFVGSSEERIREDYLRILRFFRFRGRYGSADIAADEGETFAAIQENKGGLERISGERIWSEMRQIIGSERSFAQLDAMHAAEITGVIGLPISRNWRPEALEQARVAARHGADPAVILGLLLRPTPDDPRPSATPANLQEHWKFSSEERERAELAFEHWAMAEAPYAAFLDLALAPRARRDHVAVLLTAFGRPAEAAEILGPLPEFPLRGADLVARGMRPGPEVGETMARLREAWKASGYQADAGQLLADDQRLNKGFAK